MLLLLWLLLPLWLRLRLRLRSRCWLPGVKYSWGLGEECEEWAWCCPWACPCPCPCPCLLAGLIQLSGAAAWPASDLAGGGAGMHTGHL